ncbi:hypothetical protein VP01_9385g1, partial [Puccinia sorghi]
QFITHSKHGEDIKPEILLDHLEIHLNEIKVSSAVNIEATTMFTKEDKRCIPGKHNPFSESHTKDHCWFENPKLRQKYSQGYGSSNNKNRSHNVSSLSSFSSKRPLGFILDSGSTAHMVFDKNLIQFEINHFEITKNNELYLCSCYHNNLPIIQLEAPNQHSHLSTAEQLHKALGH